ncbi:nicotinamidase-related amidase [Neomicrococcus aestuarii]|uniref:Nicotinamidase-related amidase n=1 Tax=Neomicrococcus aestuarii TaxID=556325 RepID=A0A7W8TYL6_9MICC|nr:nicotinamidase-related amidase [Neomicrococcus aestuarii]
MGNVSTILDAARAAGAPVIFNRIVVYPGAAGGTNAPISNMLGSESFKLGSWGAEIVDELKPADSDIVLDRNRMSAFNGSGLDFILRNLGVSKVVVVGGWTNMAVEHTVRDAADHGFEVSIVSDATSSINAEWHEAALSFALLNIATITDTKSVVEAPNA